MKKFESVLDRFRARALSQVEAAGILGMSERTFRRWRDRFEADGLEGLFDRRLDKASERRAPVDEIAWMVEQYRTRHVGWTVKHFHDHLKAHHGFSWGYTWAKTQLHAAGLVRKARRRGVHRRKRARRPMVGMMVHQDGSTHAWLDGHGALDLIVTLDAATSEIHSALPGRGRRHGVELPGSTGGARGQGPAVFALHRPGLSLLPHRRGRRQGRQGQPDPGRPGAGPARRRAHRGLLARGQGPLGARFRHPPGPLGQGAQAGRDHHRGRSEPVHRRGRPAGPQRPLRKAARATRQRLRAGNPGAVQDILCRHEARTVGNDNTVRYQGLSLQIPPSPMRPHFVKAKVRVHEYPDGALAIFHGPRKLASYAADGAPIGTTQMAA